MTIYGKLDPFNEDNECQKCGGYDLNGYGAGICVDEVTGDTSTEIIECMDCGHKHLSIPENEEDLF